MSEKDKETKLVFVLGMHRSGTSVTARALQVLDVDLGKNLMPAGVDNPTGFWEDLDFQFLNDLLLDELGLSWESVDPISNHDIDHLIHHAKLRAAATNLVSRKVNVGSLFGLKDPRATRLLPFWSNIASAMGIRVEIVVVVRNPLATSMSLSNRNAFDLEYGLDLWISHMLPLLRHIDMESATVTEYEGLLAEPEAHLRGIATQLSLSVNDDALEKYCSEFLNEKLWNNRPDFEVSNDTRSELVLNAYRLYQNWANKKLSTRSFNTGIDRLLEMYDQYIPTLQIAGRKHLRKLNVAATSERDSIRIENEILIQQRRGLDTKLQFISDAYESAVLSVKSRDEQNLGLSSRFASLLADQATKDTHIAQIREQSLERQQRILELEIGVEKDTRLSIELDQMRAQVAELTQALSREENEKVAMTFEVNGLRETESTLMSEISDLRESESTLLSDVSRLNQAELVFNQELKRLARDSNQFEVQLFGVQRKLSLAEQEVARFENSIEEAKVLRNDLGVEIETLRVKALHVEAIGQDLKYVKAENANLQNHVELIENELSEFDIKYRLLQRVQREGERRIVLQGKREKFFIAKLCAYGSCMNQRKEADELLKICAQKFFRLSN